MISISNDDLPIFTSTLRRQSNASNAEDITPPLRGAKSLWSHTLNRSSKIFRPQSWTGVLQKLIPRRPAPPPPVQSPKSVTSTTDSKQSEEPPDAPLYAEINKPRALPRSDSPTYYLAGECEQQPQQNWFDNPGNWLASSTVAVMLSFYYHHLFSYKSLLLVFVPWVVLKHSSRAFIC